MLNVKEAGDPFDHPASSSFAAFGRSTVTAIAVKASSDSTLKTAIGPRKSAVGPNPSAKPCVSGIAAAGSRTRDDNSRAHTPCLRERDRTVNRNRSPAISSKINFKKLACFSTAEWMVLPTTFSPQIHHDLPRTSPRFAHTKSQNPLQKRPFLPRKKFTKYTAKDPDPSRSKPPAGAHTQDPPRSPSPCP